MTLKMIAEMAGTSVSSVSKAFSGSGEISEETKEKIASLEYIQNELKGIANIAK